MDQSKLEIVITMPDGTKFSESITGAAASAGLDTFTQWIEDQNKNPGNDPNFKPKYSNPAFALKVGIIQNVLHLAERFPSNALKADVASLEAARKAVEVKRSALAALALETPK